MNPLHCRIGWNKSSFEVTAATTEGVEVNSTTVAHANLHPGDIIRVGTFDIVFDDGPLPAETKPPLPESTSTRSSRSKPKPVEPPVDEMSTFEGKVFTESDAMIESLLDDPEFSEPAIEITRKKSAATKPGVLAKRPLRPGEQEILKSPLVIGLTAGALGLLLITGIFWFLISREQSNRLYDTAVAEMNGGQHTQAISSFERFLQQYPSHSLHRQAQRGLAKVNVLKEISGATPNWKRGLDRLNDLIRAHRNESDFADLHSILFTFADQISLGAAKTAETNRDPELLVLSKDAQGLVERYADPAAPPVATVARINEQRIKAERAIQKQRTFDLAMSTVDQAIADKKPMIALSERERLVRQFPEFINSKRVKDALQLSVDLEKSVVSIDDTEVTATTTDDSPPPVAPILGLMHSRSRTDEASQGRLAFVTAKDSCYAIDTVTGEPVWRRVIGMNSAFFPVTTTGAQPVVLMFDRRKREMIACLSATGKLVWRQALNANVIGSPLIHEGQIYQATDDHSLVRIDVDTGRLTARVRLSQNLATSPALSRDGNHLLVPGEMAMIYSLTLHPTSSQQTLSAVAMTFTDHAAGSIVAPPLSMGKLLLICENDLAESARLRLWDATKPAEALVELTSTRTAGQVRDLPILRGNQLVVPSSPEQFAAFAVTDDAGRAGITLIGQYRADQGRQTESTPSPLFIALGADGQFWSAGSAFRRFEILSDSIRMDSNYTAAGTASQPLQPLGDQFFVGRKLRYSDAVIFSAIDREKLVSPWRCIVGDAPLELLPTRDDGLFWIGESGTLYTIGKTRMAQGGVDLKAGTDLQLPANLNQPLRATILHDQRMVLAAAGDTKQLILFNPAGQPANSYPLTEMLEADPILLDDGIVLPLPGRLKLLPLTPGKKGVQDWIAPIGDTETARWQSLIRIDGRELIACQTNGRLIRIQLRQGDIPHLAEVAKWDLEQPLDVRPVARGESLYVVDAGGTCRQLNIRSFDTDGQSNLPAPVRQIWSTDSSTLVFAGDGKIHCLADGKGLPERWTFDLGGLTPIGPVIVKSDSLWIGCRSGIVVVLNPGTGEELRRIELPQSLSLGLRQMKSDLWAIGIDGTLYRIE